MVDLADFLKSESVIDKSEHLQITRGYYKFGLDEKNILEDSSLMGKSMEAVKFSITVPEEPRYKDGCIKQLDLNVIVASPQIEQLLFGMIKIGIDPKSDKDDILNEYMNDKSRSFVDLLKRTDILCKNKRDNPIIDLISKITEMGYKNLLKGTENLEETLTKLRDDFENALKNKSNSKQLQPPSRGR